MLVALGRLQADADRLLLPYDELDQPLTPLLRYSRDDAGPLVSTGEWRSGRDALVRGMLASSARESGKRTLAVEAVRFPGADVAIADAPRYEIGDRKMWSTSIMMRSSSGGWEDRSHPKYVADRVSISGRERHKSERFVPLALHFSAA